MKSINFLIGLMVIILIANCTCVEPAPTELRIVNNSDALFYTVRWVGGDGNTNLFYSTCDGTIPPMYEDTREVVPGSSQLNYFIGYDVDWTNWVTVETVTVDEGQTVTFVFDNDTLVTKSYVEIIGTNTNNITVTNVLWEE